MQFSTHEFVQNAPFKVNWLGWESDIYALKNAGWDISVEDRMDMSSFSKILHFAMRHPEHQQYAMSQSVQISNEYLFGRNGGMDYWRDLVIAMKSIGSDYQVYSNQPNYFQDFRPLDLRDGPIVARIPSKLSEAKIFKTIDPDADQIILETPSLDQVLDLALELQEPKQAEIRARILADRKRNTIPDNVVDFPTKIKAQLMVAI